MLTFFYELLEYCKGNFLKLHDSTKLASTSHKITGKNIVVVGLQALDNDIGSNCINIAHEFAKDNRVLYVNFPLDRITVAREKNKASIAKRLEMMETGANNIVEAGPNLWNLFPNIIIESANWLPFTWMFRIVNWYNNYRIAKEIKSALKRLHFDSFILFNDSDMFRSYHLPEMLKPEMSVYYTRDNMMSVPYWNKHGKYLEAELTEKCDVVTANSTYLADLSKQHNPNTFYVGQGCDVSAFDMERVKEIPNDIASIQGPIIGYIGALFSLRLDISLIEHISRNHPEWSIVLIGPEDENFRKSALHTMKNVHFLGLKDANELPAYLARFDVAINPQILNEVTIGNYPRKIDEYLAMGKAVVATKTRAMSIFEEYTYLAQNASEYEKYITKALAEDHPDLRSKRIAFARSHTWENSVAEIYQAMRKVKPHLFA